MKIIDISQEVFNCNVFPGDPQPQKRVDMSISNGDICNLTSFSMCAHNGTHVDSPYHFYDDGKTMEQVSLSKFIGPCFVVDHEGPITAEDAERMLSRALDEGSEECAKRILISGKATVTEDSAKVFADHNICLIGNESQTVGPEDGPAQVHYILLGAEVVLLEGLVLKGVPEGKYLLCAQPLNLKGSDGSPCRAVLLEM